jgi:two-component system phosphate regulon sensor histidine kinase PhoR
MTHEFKTPISSIKIAADVLRNHDVIKKDDRLRQYAQIITDQNKRLNHQVEKVLNLAKLEGDEFKLQKSEIDLVKTIDQIVEDELIMYKGSSINLEKEYHDEHLKIKADRLHFTNIITNILDNAIKYSGADKNIKLSVKSDKSRVFIQICDNGNGMNKDELGKIFTKFYRVPSGNVHNVKGFGLGLYYVKNICDAHQWKIEVDSEPAKGTCFKIIIPKIYE